MAKPKPPPTPDRASKVVGASLNARDQEGLDRYIRKMAAQGVRMRPGQALGALFRRGLAAVEQEARQ